MPLYEYVCRNCGHELEALQRLSDAPLTDCPSCATASLHKKVSAAGFRLAGGGWYETDFKSGGKKNLAGDAGKAASDSAKSAQAKPAAQPAAKPAARASTAASPSGSD